MIQAIIVGTIIGGLAGLITKRNHRIGCLTRILVGLIGASLGQWLLGDWGPYLAGRPIFPAILGAVIILSIFIPKDNR
ncbi:GlsB/YeaQ/YmgE family stress response membrane protein [Streptococcus sp. sy004]|uniref:GlsB/YeaQ/YmgE family stress response membrane protein n=1 Tax=Streptococcus sp. sy004 TaxID=2600149 RepID=UPI0011B53084|nr:GlsB/YeaQ/YmgE family stress response membrane protein [Streptococcus sp. sy004]TWT12379.1 GlsB/YeaQ/YmgE family stress response membrane protein [Streptococcus sp. sy004]